MAKKAANLTAANSNIGATLDSKTEPVAEAIAEAIAIIGIGCRFPGAANSPEDFWQRLCDQVDAISDVPAGRFNVDAFYDPRPAMPGKIVTRRGGFLDQVDTFDASFFGISPREAARMDPQQRLLLEVAWEALEDAGQAPDQLAGSASGVFIGVIHNDYQDLQLRRPAQVDIYTATGGFRSSAAGRLSYALGLQGPSIVIDTSASSSLVAVHLACQSLRSQECALALAGGANLILQPEHSLGFSRAGMLSPGGRCQFCDARADGFVRSEGVGLVVLKRLSQAVNNRDPIYAVILGSAVNNDGGTDFLLTPSRQGQEAVLRRAYHNAGISPGQVHYVECHGTGTPVGDPVEVQALGAVVAEGRPQDRPCLIGSVKTNVGHTEGAAGIAGLIKTALCLKHRAIPASLHLQELNPNIPWQELPLRVQRELGPWPVEGEPALAGVSSFGITGTNAHVVLGEAPCVRSEGEKELSAPEKAQLLPLSAHSPAALAATTQAYRAFLSRDGTGLALHDVCYTASVRRTHHDYRHALVARSHQALAGQLAALQRGERPPGLASGRRVPNHPPKLAFVFSGQGSQWIGMGKQLLAQEPAFRAALERCDRALGTYVTWSLLDLLAADDAPSLLDQVDVIQPAIFALQIALAALWRAWGVEPGAVVGQSLGEVAAAHVAGALSLEDAARVICHRSQLVKRTSGQGGMAVVNLSLEQARRALAGYQDRVSVAVSSSPTATVLSGDPTALQEIMERLKRQDVFCRWVKVDYASHSPQMDPLCPEMRRLLDGLRPRPATLPMYSTVTGEPDDNLRLDARYWARNLREPVLFWPAVQKLCQDGFDAFIEISPHPILLSAIQQGLRHLGQAATVLPSLRREQPERVVMLESLASLYSLGYEINWRGLYPSGGRCVRLPPYPWQRQRYWTDYQEPSADRETGTAAQKDPGGAPGEPAQALTRETLLAAEPAERERLLTVYLCTQLARTLQLPSTGLDVRQPLTRFGLDSLMAAEFKYRIETDLKVSLSVPRLLDDLSLAQLATQLFAELTTPPPAPLAAPTPEKDAAQLLAQLDQLSDAEIDSLLDDLLAEKEFDA